jgi:tripartite-type tricarboxylate transporter receptor subunit TctC
MRRLIFSVLFVFGLGVIGRTALADRYPDSPVRAIVPYDPGGASDVLARAVSKDIEAHLGQAMIVENRPGGGAIIGTRFVANAAANGYTIGVVDSSFVINAALAKDKLPYDTLNDFAPVILLAKMPLILVVHKDVAASSLAELVAIAKAAPSILNYGSAGNGSPLHLAVEQLKVAAGIDLTHVPYKGGAPSIAAIVGGHTQVTITVLSTSRAHIQAGRLRALAVTGATRLPELPEVPTFAELGLSSVDSFVSFGVVVPKGTAPDIINALSRALNSRLREPSLQSQLIKLGFQIDGGTPQEYKKFIESEISKWTDFSAKIKIQID